MNFIKLKSKVEDGIVIEDLEKKNQELTERYRKLKQDNEILSGRIPLVFRIWPYLLSLHDNPFEVKHMPWEKTPYIKKTPDDY